MATGRGGVVMGVGGDAEWVGLRGGEVTENPMGSSRIGEACWIWVVLQ